jgi:hypothetical protein
VDGKRRPKAQVRYRWQAWIGAFLEAAKNVEAPGPTTIKGYRGFLQEPQNTGVKGSTVAARLLKPQDAQPDKLYPSMWMSDDPEIAQTYANMTTHGDPSRHHDGYLGAIAPVEGNFKNPLVVDAQNSDWNAVPFSPLGHANTDHIADWAMGHNHDAVIFKNIQDALDDAGKPATSIVALRRNTVKSPITGETLFSDSGGKPGVGAFLEAAANTETPGPSKYSAYRGFLQEPKNTGIKGSSTAWRWLKPQDARKATEMWSTDDPGVASTYANVGVDGQPYNNDGYVGAVAPVEHNFQNPLVVDAKGQNWAQIHFPQISDWNTSTDELAKWAREKGHDGLVVNNVSDTMGTLKHTPRTSIASLQPNTARSPLTGETLFSDSAKPGYGAFASAMDMADRGGGGSPYINGTSRGGAPKPTVKEAQRVAFPGIYERPDLVAERAKNNVAPESPWLKNLFGTSGTSWLTSQTAPETRLRRSPSRPARQATRTSPTSRARRTRSG